jgi:glycosyltransferase involved in cell wall biosynthesis
MTTDKDKSHDLIVICQLFYPELVSTGQTLTELVEELASYGLRIKVIASQPTILSDEKKVSEDIDYKGIKVIRTWSTRFPKIHFWGKLINLTTFFFSASFEVLFRNRNTPLLLLTNPPYLPILGWLNYLFKKINYGVLLFDIMPEQAELLKLVKPKGLLSKFWRFLNSIWYKKASYVVVLSEDMLNGAIENANLLNNKHEKECREKTHIIHVWSDDRIIIPTKKSCSSETKRLGVNGKFVIQYSGNHGRFHDVETLLGIVDKLKDDEDIIFQFIGEGFKKRLVNEFKNFRKLNNMYSSTYVEKNELSDSLAMADIGVVAQLPGQEKVCYPSKLLGIMASGRPILAICPLNCEMANMIKQNELGFVIENGDIESGVKLIRSVKLEKELLSKMGKNSYKYLQDFFTLEKAAKKYYKLILESNNIDNG